LNPPGTKQNLNLLLDDHVKKETKERPGPDRMLTEVKEESLVLSKKILTVALFLI
jgi:hypothetical protein